MYAQSANLAVYSVDLDAEYLVLTRSYRVKGFALGLGVIKTISRESRWIRIHSVYVIPRHMKRVPIPLAG